jgi:DNA-binding response OmpR family regulator
MAKRRVLVIDDEPRILDIVGYFLEQGGYDVGAFTGQNAGLAAARNARYDVAMLDIVPEGASGYDVAFEEKKIANTERVPVLFMSGKVEMADLFVESRDDRAEFILKPFKMVDLLSKVGLLCEGGGRQARKPAPSSREP